MNRRINANGQRERQPSAAAQAAMARAAGQSSAAVAPRPSSCAARTRMKIRSIYYRLVYGSVISGSPTEQSQKARAVFRNSLLGCICLIYVPSMCLGYALSKDTTAPIIDAENFLDHLHRQSFPHGSFFFGPTSHEAAIPKQSTWKHNWNARQQELLSDEDIDAEVEKKRCERYNMGYANQSHRRRLFLGALIADESMKVVQAIGTEAYNIFHTVSFIESNFKHNLTPRDLRFGVQSEGLLFTLQQLFGPHSKVSVDYYSPTITDGDNSNTDALQREGNNLRWKINGMTKDDIAIVADADQTFSRDFLRALQICDLPEFQPGQTCHESKVWGQSITYHGSPDCVALDNKIQFHPAATLGECVVKIGDASLHPSTKREWRDIEAIEKKGMELNRTIHCLRKMG